MNLKPWLLTGAAVAALTVSGCAAGPSITPLTLGQGSQFCKDMGGFQIQAADLEAAGTSGNLAPTKAQTDATVTLLLALQKDVATIPDRVSGHLVKDDLAVAVATYQFLQGQLASAAASDPQAVSKALRATETKDGQLFTGATDRLDAYSKKACGLTGSSPTTTVAPSSAPSTTLAPSGPTIAPVTIAPTTGPTPTSAPGSTAPSSTANSTTTPTTA